MDGDGNVSGRLVVSGMMQKTVAASGVLGREGKITALRLLKNFYEEQIFALLVKEFYNSDIGVSEAAINASGSLGNEIAIQHLYQIIEQGRKSQRISAISALAGIRAPSSVTQLIKYFNHFPEEDVRSEILRAINTIAPTGLQVLELNQAVYSNSKQSELVRQVASESLVETEKFSVLKDTLAKVSAGIQLSALKKMLQSGSQEVFSLDENALSPEALGAYLCLHTLKGKNQQPNAVLEALQKASRATVYSFLSCLSQFEGRLRFPTRVFRLLLICPYIDAETEALIGDFLKKVVIEVKEASPHLLSEFSVVTSAHLDNVFAKIKKGYISLQGIANKQVLLATILATILEKYATPTLLAEVIAFFKEDGFTTRTPPVAQVRSLLSSAPKEDLNRFEACIPLFAFMEKKDKLLVTAQLLKVDLNRPFYLRRLNRLIRVAGALEIRSASKRIQDILDFSRVERIHFLEETSVVTLCQLLTRSIIEQSREYFREPGKNIRSLNGYIRGSRFIPPRIMIGPLTQILMVRSLNPQSRALVVESLESMEEAGPKKSGLQDSKKLLPPLLKVMDVKEIDDVLKLRVGDILCRNVDASIGHQAMDLTSHAAAAARKAGVRLLKAVSLQSEGAISDEVTGRLYRLLEDQDKSVRIEALLALLAIGDDYAAQVLKDYVAAQDSQAMADVLVGISKPISRETFEIVLDTIQLESVAVQEALRKLLPELSQGGFAEEIRRRLVAVLTVMPGGQAQPEVAAAIPAPPVESTLNQEKVEFKFKREHTQVLTVFFIDIADYTQKSTQVDMSILLKIIKAFEEIVTATIGANRGSIVKKMGDGILAVFRQPLNAVVAAMEVQKKIRDYSAVRVEQEKFQARIGLNTGPVIRRENDIFGEHVNVASRMQGVAERGEIVLTQATFDEIHEYVRCIDGGRVPVKGFKDLVKVYYAKEITKDLSALQLAAGGQGGDKGALRDPSLEKLKESMFVPSFRVPSGGNAGSRLMSQMESVFSDLSKFVEEVAPDYHGEYEFKKYLQDRWNALVKGL